MSWAVFVDRDGVLNEHVGYLTEPGQLRLIPGAGEALRLLKSAGARVLVVTNQSGLARGLLDEGRLQAIHERLAELLAEEGGELDEILICPHLAPEGLRPGEPGRPELLVDCPCRKPKPGLLVEAARRLGLSLKDSFLIGDNTSDVQTALNAGARAVLVRTGLAGGDGGFPEAKPERVAQDLLDAARWIRSL